jgi:hypothetical protein
MNNKQTQNSLNSKNTVMQITIQGKKATIIRKWAVNPDYYVIVVFNGEPKEHIVLNEYGY